MDLSTRTHECDHGWIPEAPETYNVIGNINEWQVTIGETTFGGREEMVDTTGIIDYGSLMYLGLAAGQDSPRGYQRDDILGGEIWL